LIWNRGFEAIEPQDFAAPVRIVSENDSLLSTTRSKDLLTSASLVIDSPADSTILQISLLRPGEGIILQVDTSREDAKISLDVHLKNKNAVTSAGMLRLFLPDVIIVGLLISFLAIYLFILDDISEYFSNAGQYWAFMATSGLVIFIGLFLVFQLYRRRSLVSLNLSPVILQFRTIYQAIQAGRESWDTFKKKAAQFRF
jgi:hypothetical protein